MALSQALASLLARAAADPGMALTEAQALDLARTYGARGVRVKATALPLAPSDAVARSILPADAARAMRNLGTNMGVPTRSIGRVLPQLSAAQRQTLSDRAQDAFERDMRALADRLAETGNVQKWQRDTGARILQHMAEQRMLGAGRRLRDGDLAVMAGEAQRQTAYLSRFADHIAVDALRGERPSAAYVANRAAQYGGVGRAAFFDAQQRAEAGRPGMVVIYRALDDASTCTRCHDAEANGPYLPGAAPLPGSVCLGRSRCRCRLEYRYDAAAYQRLIGKAA